MCSLLPCLYALYTVLIWYFCLLTCWLSFCVFLSFIHIARSVDYHLPGWCMAWMGRSTNVRNQQTQANKHTGQRLRPCLTRSKISITCSLGNGRVQGQKTEISPQQFSGLGFVWLLERKGNCKGTCWFLAIQLSLFWLLAVLHIKSPVLRSRDVISNQMLALQRRGNECNYFQCCTDQAH